MPITKLLLDSLIAYLIIITSNTNKLILFDIINWTPFNYLWKLLIIIFLNIFVKFFLLKNAVTDNTLYMNHPIFLIL